MLKKEEGVPDFVLLDELTEDALMNNLRMRYKKDLIYTYIGEVVVSVNPYKKMDHLYDKKKVEEYRGRQMYEVPPHIFSLSNDVYRNLLQNKENQCVIISGESGAGKTEASKIFMQYIAAVSKSSAEVDLVKNQLLESNPLLEAFGNAKTLRNDNSSRFGKYMEIQFEYSGAPTGGKITNYLLEKSRVVVRAKGERSFHIFFQMLSGLSDQELSQLGLNRDANGYAYLSNSECTTVDTINDKADFAHVKKAMSVLGFSNDLQSSVWKILSGILFLGNIAFANNTGGQYKVKAINQDAVDKSSKALDVDPILLNRVLVSRSISTGVGKRASLITIPLDLQQVVSTRDALAKAIYARLFLWLVEHMNQSLTSKKTGPKLQLGILDIYGFEVFENNSFEQFCINLCNEKLQQLFIELTLKSEQEEYVREGIQWEPVKYFNNKIICDLIEGKSPVGIISLMDECSLMAESTDLMLLDRMNHNYGKHAHYESYATRQDRTLDNHSFRLKHYAGDVTYNIVGFLDKSMDTLFTDLISAMNTSSSKILPVLFPAAAVDTKKRPLTAATQFKNALAALMDTLLACQPHYIRCIKPNDVRKPDHLDEERTRHQVRYLGLLENVRVRRAGFAYRQKYEIFLWRYKMTCKDTWPGATPGLVPQKETHKIMSYHKIADEEYRFGKTKIFIRNPRTIFFFEEQREKALPRIVTLIQKIWRGFMCRRKWKERKAAISIQAAWKGYSARKKWQKRKAAIKMLLMYRKAKSRRWLLTVREAFSAVKTDPALGKNVVWPKPPVVLRQAEALVKNIHRYWRAYQMVTRLGKSGQAEMRQKILAYNIFHAKKPWSCGRVFAADYLQMDSNPGKDKYIQGMENLFAKYGDTSVLFADYADKINSKNKAQKRAIVVTEKHIYKQDPKNYKVKKFETPLDKVTSISMSPKDDSFVVVHAEEPNRDLVFDLGITGQEKLSEFVSVIVYQVKQLTGQDLKVQFTDNISYNNARTPSKSGSVHRLTFQAAADPKQQGFKVGKGGNNVVLYSSSKS